MTEQDDRAERAFRDAFAAHGGAAPREPLEVPTGPRRRTWWVAGVAAAAVIVGVVVPTVLLAGDGGRRAEPAVDDPTSESPPAPFESRWVSHLGTEVAVPADWTFDYAPVRPDCIQIDDDVSKDPWAEGTPTAPYVEVEPASRVVPLIGCSPDRAGRGPEEFGDLPVALWQPHVLLEDPPLDGKQGEWTHRGWTLTRQTIGEASITVLAAPGDEELADQILSTAREVGIDENGCETRSDIQATEFVRPRTGAVPSADFDGLIAVCEYLRGNPREPGLLASRQITGDQVRSLIAAIRAAPAGLGPDRPQNCVDDMYGELAIELRFLPTNWTARDIGYPEAYVYFDWCFGNGIVDDTAAYQLTKDNCRPLFTEAPIRMWSASGVVAEVCWPPRT